MDYSLSSSIQTLSSSLLHKFPKHSPPHDSGSKIVTLDVHKAKNLIQSGHVYLDVRRVEDFQKGHVDADKIFNIPYLLDTPKGKAKNPEFVKQVSCACDRGDHIIVGCDCGMKSLYATADLQADGFKDVKNMEGGYRDWVKNRFPVKPLAGTRE